MNKPDEIAFTKTNAKKKFSKESPLLKLDLVGKVEKYFSSNKE